ncbi:ABC transporter ATP-binding protein [Aquibium sp. LZ166]|uniref:ABC transporter ATP-binding protein n=1 Tax=Aquibium pacificus TaxID=3153579 RepID=A0ABV3SP79_9HYPH
MLELHNVEVTYSDVILALKGVSLSLREGQCVALLGGNGAGKSTTLKAISGTLKSEDGKVSAGAITLEGTPIHNLEASEVVRRGLIHVMEGRRVLRHMTAEQNLIVGGHMVPDRTELKRRLDHVYTLMPRLADLKSRTAGFMSGGEQQLLLIGRAMMARPKIIAIDEPSLGLAPLMIRDVYEVLSRLKEEGTTFFLVEQNSAAGLGLADYAYVLENGRVVLDGRADKLAQNEDVKEFYLGVTASGERKSYREVKHYRRRKRWLG